MYDFFMKLLGKIKKLSIYSLKLKPLLNRSFCPPFVKFLTVCHAIPNQKITTNNKKLNSLSLRPLFHFHRTSSSFSHLSFLTSLPLFFCVSLYFSLSHAHHSRINFSLLPHGSYIPFSSLALFASRQVCFSPRYLHENFSLLFSKGLLFIQATCLLFVFL